MSGSDRDKSSQEMSLVNVSKTKDELQLADYKMTTMEKPRQDWILETKYLDINLR